MNKLLSAVMLLILNVTAHFLPFERAALAPDDYASLVRLQGSQFSLMDYADRPLNFLFLHLQSLVIGDSAFWGFMLLLASSSFLLISVFLLLNELLGDGISAFLASAIFCLLPNTLEIYHTAIFANINFALSVYLLCLFFYLRYLDSGRAGLLFASTALYAVGVFWYEAGFFTPLIMLVAVLLRKKDKALSWIVFLPVSAVYIAFRLTGAFGIAARVQESHAASLGVIPFNLIELAHHYVGRYMARSVLYGLFKLPSIEMPWILIAGLLGMLFALVIVGAVRRYEPKKVPAKVLVLACAISIFWLAPILLNERGGIGGRHLVLPSLGIAILALWLFGFIRRGRGLVTGVFFLILLAISLGNGWSQVIACRINAAIYNYLKDSRPALQRASYVVIDVKSFAQNIPFTFVDRDFNVLNTYYGAQALEEWGLRSMVRLAAGDKEKAVYIAKSRPGFSSGKIEFDIPKYQGYRAETAEQVSLDAGKSFIVDYDSVYAKGFRNGAAVK